MRVFTLILSMLLAANALAETHNVSSMQELQQALNQAASNEEADIIMLGAGTYDFSSNTYWLEYRPEGPPQPAEKFPLTIRGAGVDQTILDGGGQMGFMYISNDRLQNANEQNDAGANISISNLTLKDPGASGPLTISTIQATITVNNIKSVTEECGTGGSDVILMSDSGMITLTNSTFAGSQTCNTWAGATLQSGQGMTTVTGCTFAYNDSQRDGVGLMAATISGNVNISGNDFEHNNAYGHSGALQVVIAEQGSTTIAQNTFTDNTGGRGSGVNVVAGQSSGVGIEDNTFTDNGWGAWVDTAMGAVIVKDNRFEDNNPGGVKIIGQGGQGSATLVNNIITGPSLGVGAYVQMDSVTVTNNTITSNGYGLEIRQTENTAVAEIYNNIIWGSTEVDVNIFDDEPGDGTGAGVELFNNDFSVLDIQVGDNLTQGDNLDIDPQLAVDFHLLSYSPVIDMGTDAPGLPDEDFEGDDRTIDADDDGTSEPDMGADEAISYNPAPQVIATMPEDGATDVPLDTLITATFSKRMIVSSINMDSFKVDPAVPGGVTYDPTTRTATFEPNKTELDPVTIYTVTITTAAKAEDGSPLTSDYVWSFTTTAAADGGIDGGADGGSDAGTDAGGDEAGENGDGCGGCSVRATGSGSAFAQYFAILGLLLIGLRRRRS